MPVLSVPDAYFFRCQVMGAPLECFHLPRFARVAMKNAFPPLMKDAKGQNILDDDVLRVAAEVRAAELRSRLGIAA